MKVYDDIPVSTICQRYFRNNINIDHNHGGHTSPLASIEVTVVKIVIQMARIRQSLNHIRGLALINSLIKDQPIQKNLIEWKTNFSNDEVGTVGAGC